MPHPACMAIPDRENGMRLSTCTSAHAYTYTHMDVHKHAHMHAQSWPTSLLKIGLAKPPTVQDTLWHVHTHTHTHTKKTARENGVCNYRRKDSITLKSSIINMFWLRTVNMWAKRRTYICWYYIYTHYPQRCSYLVNTLFVWHQRGHSSLQAVWQTLNHHVIAHKMKSDLNF